MGGGFGRAMEAAAIGIGAAMEGFGKGTMQDYMIKREEYMDMLKEQRMVQRDAQDRAYRSEEAEKGRGFEKEMFGEKMGWDKEKFGMEQAAEEKQFERQSALQLKIAGINAAKGGGEGGIKSTITDKDGKVWGITKTGQKVDLGINAPIPGGGGSIPDDIEVSNMMSDLEVKAEAGDEDAERKLKNLKSLAVPKGAADTAAKDTYSDFVAEKKNISDPMNMADAKLRQEPQEEQDRVALERVTSSRQKFGLQVPDMSQESKTGAPQPQGVEAPNATPPGQGSEARPLTVTTEEQKAWVMQNSPKGAWIAYNGKLFQK